MNQIVKIENLPKIKTNVLLLLMGLNSKNQTHVLNDFFDLFFVFERKYFDFIVSDIKVAIGELPENEKKFFDHAVQEWKISKIL